MNHTLSERIQRYPTDAETGIDFYMLPSSTVGARAIICTNAEEAKNAGMWTARMFTGGGVERIEIASYEGRDCIWVKFESDSARESKQRHVESALNAFVATLNPDGSTKSPKLSLVSRMGTITEEEFEATSEQYMAQHRHEPHIAGIKTIIHLFNECVAGPDGGEIKFKQYVTEENQGANQGIVEIEMLNACSDCSMKTLSANGQLLGLFRKFMPRTVHGVRIV